MTQWYDITSANCYRGGKQGVEMYNAACTDRRANYPVATEKYKDIIAALNTDGFCVIKNAADPIKLKQLKNEFEIQVAANENLKEHSEHFTVVDQALVNCPTIKDFAFSNLVLDIASEYFNCLPALGTFNLRKSYVNTSNPVKHQIFHSDPNSIKFIKFFFYLNDVDMEGGPFCIVKGSLYRKFSGWLDKYRWTEEEMKAIYGEDSIQRLTANAGDMIIANTTCFHKGIPPTKQDRTMLTLNYVVHPEDWKKPTFQIKKDDYENLPDNVKPAADYLVKI
jgi:hypothetical protein